MNRTARPSRSSRSALIASATLGLTATVLSATVLSAGDPPSTPWTVGPTVLASGGTSTDATWAITGTIGDAVTGGASTSDWAVSNGFEAAVAAGPAAPPCPGDIDADGAVGFSDLLRVLAAWGVCPGCPEDLDGDEVVGFSDLLEILARFGPCP